MILHDTPGDILKELLTTYGLNPSECRVSKFSQGHIHDTYLVSRSDSHAPSLILQKINTHVFPDVNLLMKNMENVTSHIAHKNRERGYDPAQKGIVLLETEDRESHTGNDVIGYWRMFWYIQDQMSYEQASTLDIAYEGGKEIARFQAMLLDLDPASIKDSIPLFHSLGNRLVQFENARANADPSRLKRSEQQIRYVIDNAAYFLEIYDLCESNLVPLRLTHNDTKFNNILFDRSGRATCLIDLDTVMRGYSWYDFGDALRTCASRAPENETDLNRIGFKTEIFESFAKGFLEIATGFLTPVEKGVLYRAPAVFTFMMGVRFLTDYLNGDIYYKISRKDENLDRTISQLTLTSHIHKDEIHLKNIIDSIG